MKNKPFFVSLLPSGLLWGLAILTGCSSLSETGEGMSSTVLVGADNPFVEYSGRATGIGTSRVSFGYSGARVRLRFEGESVTLLMDDDSSENYVAVFVDGERSKKVLLNVESKTYPLAEGLTPGEHTIEVVRATECHTGLNHFEGFEIGGEGAKALEWKSSNNRKIEFIGDSITCGYGVEVDDPNLHFELATEDFTLGYSALTARALDADYLVVSRSGIGIVRNYDGPFEGSVDTMPSVYPYNFYLKPELGTWDYGQYTPDVVCVNLGTNDFSTTGVNVEKYIATYIEFGKMLVERYPNAQLVILQGPMQNSPELRTALDKVVSGVSSVASGRIHFLELSAQGSVGLGADWHPNRAQSKINAAELTKFLSELMNW